MINLLKDKKAVSPVIAVLLMVAIAVVAALITYSWVTGFVTTTTTKAGHAIQIQAVDTSPSGSDIVYVQNVGEGSVVVSGVLINGALDTSASATVDTTTYTFGSDSLAEGEVLKITLSQDLSTGDKVRVICNDGTFTEYTVP